MDQLPIASLRGSTGIIINSTANLRSKPSFSSELVSQSTMGLKVRILDKKDNWYYVQTIDKYLGWMHKKSLSFVNEKDLESWIQSERVIITSPYARLSYEDQVVCDLVMGDLLELVTENEEYGLLKTPDGRKGLLDKKYYMLVSNWKSNSQIDFDRVIQRAKENIGIPYLWGGASSKGYDCSGFTKSLFFMEGIILPRDASQQVHCGTLIQTDLDLKELQRGDLLYFGRMQEEKEKVTHVAIYMGDGLIIHATGRVIIESLDPNSALFAADRYASFLRAKRLKIDSTMESVKEL